MYVSMYVCMYVCVYVCMYLCMYYVCIFCMYVYIYIYIYVCKYVCMSDTLTGRQQRRAARFTLHRYRCTSSVGDMLQGLEWQSLDRLSAKS